MQTANTKQVTAIFNTALQIASTFEGVKNTIKKQGCYRHYTGQIMTKTWTNRTRKDKLDKTRSICYIVDHFGVAGLIENEARKLLTAAEFDNKIKITKRELGGVYMRVMTHLA